eukprot:1157605-Pelagomonas_calceolata.AAC.2
MRLTGSITRAHALPRLLWCSASEHQVLSLACAIPRAHVTRRQHHVRTNLALLAVMLSRQAQSTKSGMCGAFGSCEMTTDDTTTLGVIHYRAHYQIAWLMAKVLQGLPDDLLPFFMALDLCKTSGNVAGRDEGWSTGVSRSIIPNITIK